VWHTGGGIVKTSLRTPLIVLCIGTMLGGCATKMGTGAAVGAAAGAGVGAVVGQVGGDTGMLIGAAAGAILGGVIGAIIGQRLDKRDKAKREAALQESFKTAQVNQQVAWVNPDTGNSGTAKPLNEAQAQGSGPVCREFEESYTREGKTVTYKSRACLNTDGTWVMRD
jgi:surface antigen